MTPSLLRLHIGWLHQERGGFNEALAQYELAIDLAVRPADFLSRLYLNLATVAQELGDQKRKWWAARNVLNIESSLGKETELSRQARQFLPHI